MNNIVHRPRSQAGLLALELNVHPKALRQRLRRLLRSQRIALGHARCKPWAFSKTDLVALKAALRPRPEQGRRNSARGAPPESAPSAPPASETMREALS